MKHYTITFEVPDDFNPDNMSLSASYPDSEIPIFAEGFLDLTSIINDKLELSKLDISEGDIVRFTFPSDIGIKSGVPENNVITLLNRIKEGIEEDTGATAIGHVNDISLMVEHPDESIELLNNLIAEIRDKAGSHNG